MRRVGVCAGLLLGLLLVACQPQVAFVEVTRIVTGEGETAVSTPATPQPVTRIVPQEVTRIVPQEVVVTVEVTRPPLGTAERPIQLLFPPVTQAAVINDRGEPLAQALGDATGLSFAVGVLDSEQAVIDLMCAAPMDTIGFLSALGYARAHAQCGVQPGMVAVGSDGMPWQYGMIVARRDSGINVVADLAGKTWGVPDPDSVPQFAYFQAQLAAAGVEPAEVVALPGVSSAMLAVYEGEVDFVTAAYVPPILPYDERPWDYESDSPEIWRQTGVSPSRSPIGYVIVLGEPEFGGYRLRDDRASIFDTTPGIYDETRIVALSPPIPRGAVAFGADFPLGLSRQVTAVLTEFAAAEACGESLCANDLYGWTGLQPVTDAAYEPLRLVLESES